MKAPDPTPASKQARRAILTHLKATAWKLLDEIVLREEILDRPLSSHASDGTTRIDIVVSPAGDMPRLGLIDLERRIWAAIAEEKQRHLSHRVKSSTIARLLGRTSNSGELKYCLRFMVERGWLTLRRKRGYDLAVTERGDQ